MSQASPSAGRLLERGAQELERAGVSRSRWEAEVLLRQAMGCSRETLLADLAEPVEAEAAGYFFQLVDRRRGRVPLQYLLGSQEFWGLTFQVTPAVFIPRPETECLVEEAIRRLGHRPVRVADVGCGSGCVAISIAASLPDSQLYAIDLSPAALAVAGENARRNEVSSRIEFLQGDLLHPLLDRSEPPLLDAVVSNPPYVPEPDLVGLQPEVKDHEPRLALAAGPDGLDVVRRLLPQAESLLVPGGFLLLEIGMGMENKVKSLLAETRLTWQTTVPDLQGFPRILVAQQP
ncbi:MAG TPA: peptide chain release factor N(5)-glutamine methyltransferase [Vicinamibacteria bacterium]|nr:peptide chain release factor N(5)-glutamine methyltransferase [Vicinamibacteria bacterium]